MFVEPLELFSENIAQQPQAGLENVDFICSHGISALATRVLHMELFQHGV